MRDGRGCVWVMALLLSCIRRECSSVHLLRGLEGAEAIIVIIVAALARG
jgi:hypothetical protein